MSTTKKKNKKKKHQLFTTIPLENLQLSVFYYFLPARVKKKHASSVVCYIQRAVQTERFTLFY